MCVSKQIILYCGLNVHPKVDSIETNGGNLISGTEHSLLVVAFHVREYNLCIVYEIVITHIHLYIQHA